ncbi:MAG TPA: hypothetical protein PLS66_02875, partial [Tepiditoga sp.]|nr:hypothetical protein [Tepiditoga sp.]
IFLTLFTSLIGSLNLKYFIIDYLMPAELFPAALIGSIIISYVSAVSKLYLKSSVINFIILILSFFGINFAAVITGLASGDYPPEGYRFVIVIFLLIIYILSVISEGVLSILIILKLKKVR